MQGRNSVCKTKQECYVSISLLCYLVGKKTFTDLSVLYLEYLLTNLDEDLFQNFQENEVPRLDSANSGKFLALSF